MFVRFAILAHYAFAFLGAFDSCSVTVAVIFAAFGLFAGALAFGDQGRDAFEGARVSVIG